MCVCVCLLCSDHYADLLHERDELSRQKSDMKRRCHEAQQEVAGKHKMVSSAEEERESSFSANKCKFQQMTVRGEGYTANNLKFYFLSCYCGIPFN